MPDKPKRKPRSAAPPPNTTPGQISGFDSLIISEDRKVAKSTSLSDVLKSSPVVAGMRRLAKDVDEFDEEAFLNRMLGKDARGKYAIREKMTEGGMGEIYYVFDRDFQRYSVMKVILPKLKRSGAAFEAFVREARVTGQLEHPNIVPVHDLGYLPEMGTFFTMKMVRGEPLIDILRQLEFGEPKYVKRYDMYALLSAFRKVCDAVAFAHSRGIVHRDIKPHNIMIGDYGEVLLMDWGLSKRMSGSENVQRPRPMWDATQTQLGVIKGSPAYMSPEQAYGGSENLDERSDIFLLGATLYHMFTFYPPYLGDDVYDIVEKAREHVLMPPDELGTSRLHIPDELSRITMKAMAREKTDRYQTVEELIADLDALLRGDMRFSRRTFAAGEYLIHQNDTDRACYIIVSGAVQVRRERVGDEPLSIATLDAGAIVGEMALITHEPRTASVVATEPTEVLVLDQEQFVRNLDKLPGCMSRTIHALAERLSEATRRVSRLAE